MGSTERLRRKVGQQILAAAGFPAGWSGLRPGRSRLESRLQAGLPAPQFVAAPKETRI
jgi:hypothetical protein